MILLIDYGNTRIKWRLAASSGVHCEGFFSNRDHGSLSDLAEYGSAITRVAVSMVGSEQAMATLKDTVGRITSAPIRFYWAERQRGGLKNAYVDPSRMGADRWHAMVGAWSHAPLGGIAVIDAGSALTVDYIAADGQHVGGYIVPGLQMMRQSLQKGAARVAFEDNLQLDTAPGSTTSECVNHGLAWLNAGIVQRISDDIARLGLGSVVLTGGDAPRFQALGLAGDHRPGLVFEGLARVDAEGEAS